MVLVKMSSWEEKEKVMARKSKLRGNDIFIEHNSSRREIYKIR